MSTALTVPVKYTVVAEERVMMRETCCENTLPFQETPVPGAYVLKNPKVSESYPREVVEIAVTI